MQKKIIALAIASALTVPALALADTGNVTVYGQANVSYDFVKTGGNNDVTNNKVSTNASRLGLKGSEDLGGDLSVIWQIESGIAFDVGGDTLATRNTFAGLSSKSAGSVTLGKNDVPYKTATRRLDMFGDSLADSRSLTGVNGAMDMRANDLISYNTPEMSGFSGAIAYANKSEDRVNSVATPDKSSVVSLAGMYNAGPLYATMAYQKVDLGKTDHTGWKLGVGYTMAAFTGNIVYENVDLDTTDDTKIWYLAGKYSFGNDAVKAAYTRDDMGGNTKKAKQWSLGYDHNMSKRTSLYALYTKMNDVATTVTLGACGNQNCAKINGDDPSGFSFGLKHSF